MVLGPCNTVTANVVPANRRAAAYAAFIFLIHLFGDISSLVLLGWVSDFFGQPSVAGSAIGRFFASIGAGPVDGTNLTVAMLSVVPVLALGCVFFLIGSRYLPADQEKVRSAGGRRRRLRSSITDREPAVYMPQVRPARLESGYISRGKRRPRALGSQPSADESRKKCRRRLSPGWVAVGSRHHRAACRGDQFGASAQAQGIRQARGVGVAIVGFLARQRSTTLQVGGNIGRESATAA